MAVIRINDRRKLVVDVIVPSQRPVGPPHGTGLGTVLGGLKERPESILRESST
jgi:hypothetical protein